MTPASKTRRKATDAIKVFGMRHGVPRAEVARRVKEAERVLDARRTVGLPEQVARAMEKLASADFELEVTPAPEHLRSVYPEADAVARVRANGSVVASVPAVLTRGGWAPRETRWVMRTVPLEDAFALLLGEPVDEQVRVRALLDKLGLEEV